MKNINLSRQHMKGRDYAVQAVDQIAQQMAQTHGITYTWKGDTVYFSKNGIGTIKGTVKAGEKKVSVEIKCDGMLVEAIAPTIEQQVQQYLAYYF